MEHQTVQLLNSATEVILKAANNTEAADDRTEEESVGEGEADAINELVEKELAEQNEGDDDDDEDEKGMHRHLLNFEMPKINLVMRRYFRKLYKDLLQPTLG